MLTIVLALLSACSNAAASVLMRRAATARGNGGNGNGGGDGGGTARGTPDGPGTQGGPGAPDGGRGTAGRRSSRSARARARRFWLAGASLMGVSALLQAAALSVGSLALVQPLLATELLFTLVLGSLVFHRRPDRITWLSFLALAAGLALFLGAADPTPGSPLARNERWIPVGIALACLVIGLLVVGRLLRGAPRAAVLGLASAVLFSATAAFLKEATGVFPQGPAALVTHWTPYATAAAGLAAFGVLQLAFRAGTLVASQPALTLGDALTSVVLGVVLFGERIALGFHLLPEAVGIGLIATGTIGLARSPAVSGEWDTEPARGTAPDRGRAQAERP
ncbi:DMT family transporter [Streptomyces thermogriseus]|uniref:DMT family transporter n=1 Tax=Streptomyces thermogriseus TaxID=75292 RepID=A0ABP4DG54_9ACTN